MIRVFFGNPLVKLPQDPDDDLDYTVDWSRFLREGETLSSSEWEASDEAATLHDKDSTSDSATAWVKGLTAGTVVTVTNSIVTSAGRKKDLSFKLEVTEH